MDRSGKEPGSRKEILLYPLDWCWQRQLCSIPAERGTTTAGQKLGKTQGRKRGSTNHFGAIDGRLARCIFARAHLSAGTPPGPRSHRQCTSASDLECDLRHRPAVRGLDSGLSTLLAQPLGPASVIRSDLR